MDITNLNKACQKESYPLLNIDNLVNATLRYAILSFCDAFVGYNQILMQGGDHLKIKFRTDERVFHYKVMLVA